MRRQKLLPVVRLFLGRLPWRRGKQPKMCFGPGLGTENDFNHLVQFIRTAIRIVACPGSRPRPGPGPKPGPGRVPSRTLQKKGNS